MDAHLVAPVDRQAGRPLNRQPCSHVRGKTLAVMLTESERRARMAREAKAEAKAKAVVLVAAAAGGKGGAATVAARGMRVRGVRVQAGREALAGRSLQRATPSTSCGRR